MPSISSKNKEVFYLYLIQISNMVLPLFLIPYLTSVLGVVYYGKLAFAQSIALLSGFFVDFGFNFSAARRVNLYDTDSEEISRLYVNVFAVKLTIFSVLIVFLSLSDLFLNLSKIDTQLMYIGCLSSLVSVIMPYWFFQGIGKNSVISLMNFFIRLLSLICVFLFVHDVSDVIFAAVIQLFLPAISGLFVYFYLSRNFKLSFDFSFISLSYSRVLISESFHNFSASLMTLGFTYFNPLVIKLLFGDHALGIYSLADKLVNVLRQFYNPLAQAKFSTMCDFFKEGGNAKGSKVLLQVFLVYTMLSLLAIISNLIFGKWIVHQFFAGGFTSDDIRTVVSIISMLIFLQFVVSISIISVNLVIIPSGYSRILKVRYFIGLCFYAIILFPLCKIFAVFGVPLSLIFVESLIVLLFVIKIRELKLIFN